jgi:hypothetical protein
LRFALGNKRLQRRSQNNAIGAPMRFLLIIWMNFYHRNWALPVKSYPMECIKKNLLWLYSLGVK